MGPPVVTSFIHDNVGAGNPIVTVASLSSATSEGNTLDITFLGIFEVRKLDIFYCKLDNHSLLACRNHFG